MKDAELKSFFAKILLFGEYSIMYGGNALTLPFKNFSGCFAFNPLTKVGETAFESNRNLKSYFSYLENNRDNEAYVYKIDYPRLKGDLEKGLFFDSDIPQGYGAGSSGALVAALLSSYSPAGNIKMEDLNQQQLQCLKSQLAHMESWFHGSSSGLDPLSCFLSVPVLIDHNNYVSFPWISRSTASQDISVFLIDSGNTGKTQPLVEWFRTRVNEKKLDVEQLIDLNNQALDAYLVNKSDEFFNWLSQLSLFQLGNMQPMIPLPLRDIWLQGLVSRNYYLKLCGSGGGGFFLGFTSDYDRIEASLANEGFTVSRLT